MHVYDRRDGFPRSASHEISILSWNLLAPSLSRGAPEWTAVRLPALQHHLQRFAACDIMCFQEVDTSVSLAPLREVMGELGFTLVVQDRQDFTMVNATFFKRDRFQLSWAQHRSRALLVGLRLPNGHEIGIANVHLEAGMDADDHSQRNAQLSSALRRLQERKSRYAVVCGDFNSPLQEGTPLRELLCKDHYLPTMRVGSTHTHGWALDHVWAGAAMQAESVLGSPSEVLAAILKAGIPNVEHPSDHLPVGALFRLNEVELPVVQLPVTVDAAICDEWIQILQSAGKQNGKQARKQQRNLEKAFLQTITPEEGFQLCRWRDSVGKVASLVCDSVVAKSLVAASQEHVVHRGALKSIECHCLRDMTPGWAGG